MARTSHMTATAHGSVDAWLTPDAAPVGGTIVSKYRSSLPNPQISWSFGVITDGRLRLTVCGTPTCSVLRTRDMNDTSILPGVANHVAATFDVATNDIKFYVNGVERPSTLTNASVLSSIATTTEPVRIGSFIAASGQIQSPVVGLTDEVEIFDRALSAEEIQRIAAAGPAGKCRTDHFMAYKTKITKGTPKPVRFGPVTLQDQFGMADYTVIKPDQLLLPANKNAEGVLDEDTHLEEYKVRPVAGTPKFTLLSNVRVTNQCNDLLLEVKKPVSLLVPAAKDLATPPTEPTDSGLDHYLCYLAKPQKKDAAGNKLPAFPKGLQVDVTDQFQTRRYDLKKITKLCNPVDKSGAPLISNGPDAGEPKPITPAAIGDPDTHLVCYQAKLAKKYIAQNGCGPADPTDNGTKIDPKQEPHEKRSGVYVANQFGSEQVDTIKEFELCIPSMKALE